MELSYLKLNDSLNIAWINSSEFKIKHAKIIQDIFIGEIYEREKITINEYGNFLGFFK